jgi:hypothetical protein
LDSFSLVYSVLGDILRETTEESPQNTKKRPKGEGDISDLVTYDVKEEEAKQLEY